MLGNASLMPTYIIGFRSDTIYLIEYKVIFWVIFVMADGELEIPKS